MRNLVYLCLTILFLSCGESQTSRAQTASGETDGVLSAELFKSKLEANGANTQLIDVRTPEEFGQGAIPGAKNFNFYDEDFATQLQQLDPQQPVYVYCKSGGRSGKTYKQLKQLGFSEVYDLKGGFSKWPY